MGNMARHKHAVSGKKAEMSRRQWYLALSLRTAGTWQSMLEAIARVGSHYGYIPGDDAQISRLREKFLDDLEVLRFHGFHVAERRREGSGEIEYLLGDQISLSGLEVGDIALLNLALSMVSGDLGPAPAQKPRQSLRQLALTSRQLTGQKLRALLPPEDLLEEESRSAQGTGDTPTSGGEQAGAGPAWPAALGPDVSFSPLIDNHFVELAGYCHQRQVLAFSYDSVNSARRSWRRVVAYRLQVDGGEGYLLAWDLENQRPSTFKIGRMIWPLEILNPSPGEAAIQAEIDTYMQAPQPIRALVAVAPSALWSLAARGEALDENQAPAYGADCASLSSVPADWQLLSLDGRSIFELATEISPYLEEVVVLAPSELRQEVAQRLTQLDRALQNSAAPQLSAASEVEAEAAAGAEDSPARSEAHPRTPKTARQLSRPGAFAENMRTFGQALALFEWLQSDLVYAPTVEQAAAHFDLPAQHIRELIELLLGDIELGLDLSFYLYIEADGTIVVNDSSVVDIGSMIDFRLDEVAGMALALQMLKNSLPPAQSPRIERVLQHLYRQCEQVAGIEEALSFEIDAWQREVVAHLEQAQNQDRRLHLSYVNGRGEISQRPVGVTKLFFSRQGLYFNAWDYSAGTLRTFRADRVRSLQLGSEAAFGPEVPPHIRQADFQMFPGDQAHSTCRLLLSGKGRWLAEKMRQALPPAVTSFELELSYRDLHWLGRTLAEVAPALQAVVGLEGEERATLQARVGAARAHYARDLAGAGVES